MGTPGQWCLQGSGSQKWSLQVSEPSPAHNKFSRVWGVSDLIQGVTGRCLSKGVAPSGLTFQNTFLSLSSLSSLC